MPFLHALTSRQWYNFDINHVPSVSGNLFLDKKEGSHFE